MGFMDLEKAYDKVNRELLWQMLRMYDVNGKQLNGIKSIYVNSLTCVKLKEGENKCFRMNSGLKQGCIIFPWLFSIYMDTVMKEVKIEMEGRGGREQRLHGLLYADKLILCGESEEDLKAMVGSFIEVCRKKRSESQCR